MSKDSAFKKIKDFFVTQLSEQEQSALKDFVAPIQTPVSLKEVKTKDAKVLNYEGETLTVDTMVTDVTSGEPVPAEGEYELEDGSKLVCVAGKVTEMIPSAAPEGMDMNKIAPVIAQEVATQMSSIKLSSENKTNELIEANLKLQNQVVELTKIVNTILETPISLGEHKEISKPYEEMTKVEKVRFNRGKL
jgi:hypothetical protein